MTSYGGWGSGSYEVMEFGTTPTDYGKGGRLCECCSGPCNRYRGKTRVGRRGVLLCCNCLPDDWLALSPKEKARNAKRSNKHPKPERIKDRRSRSRSATVYPLPGLASELRARGLTASELAKKAGLTPNHVQRLARLAGRASEETALDLAAVLNVSVEKLRGEAGEMVA